MPDYFNEAELRGLVDNGEHRNAIGGLWDEIGTLQSAFLIANGLERRHRFLDLGCGSLRAGVKLVPYLDPGCYYGIDISPSLLDAGYKQEIKPLRLSERLPRANLNATPDFDVSPFNMEFDFGIAQSLFTHLPLGEFQRCLTNVGPYFRQGGQLFATFFEAPDDTPSFRHPAGKTTYPDRDPFHFSAERLAVSTPLMWQMQWIGDWGHPRDQKLARFVRQGRG